MADQILALHCLSDSVYSHAISGSWTPGALYPLEEIVEGSEPIGLGRWNVGWAIVRDDRGNRIIIDRMHDGSYVARGGAKFVLTLNPGVGDG